MHAIVQHPDSLYHHILRITERHIINTIIEMYDYLQLCTEQVIGLSITVLLLQAKYVLLE